MDLDARLTVLGSLNMDISVTVPALPGPGATVLGGPAAFAPGGKGANQAVAAARLGSRGQRPRPDGRLRRATTTSAGRCGGRWRAEGVDDRAVRTVPGVPTGIAMITVDQAGENIITVAPGANHEVGAPEIAVISESAGAAAGAGSANVLVISAEVPAILAAIRARSARRAAPDRIRAGTPRRAARDG